MNFRKRRNSGFHSASFLALICETGFPLGCKLLSVSVVVVGIAETGQTVVGESRENDLASILCSSSRVVEALAGELGQTFFFLPTCLIGAEEIMVAYQPKSIIFFMPWCCDDCPNTYDVTYLCVSLTLQQFFSCLSQIFALCEANWQVLDYIPILLMVLSPEEY